jgi:hypothetical protein
MKKCLGVLPKVFPFLQGTVQAMTYEESQVVDDDGPSLRDKVDGSCGTCYR